MTKACWLAVGVSLRCLMAVPANGLTLQTNSDPRKILWPSFDQEQYYKNKSMEWQREEMEKHGVRTGKQCYNACCGLGHRNRRTLAQATQAWTHGQPLSVEWPSCNGVSAWKLVQDEQIMLDKYREWIIAGDQKNRSDCQVEVGNEPLFDADLEAELASLYRGPEDKRLEHPATKWYYALQQIGFNYSPLGSIAARFLQQEFTGHVVIGVHLRLGNGEEAAIKDDRLPNITRQDVFRYVSHTADRIAEEVLNVGAEYIRIFVASDTHSALEEFQRFDPRVFFFTGGQWLQENQGVPINVGDDEACADLEHTVMLEAVLLGYADVLVTPQWSELTAISKNLALSRGAHWCENQQWLGKSGNIPDPDNADVDAKAVRFQVEHDDATVAIYNWEAILNGCPAEDCTEGYKCYYEDQGLQSRFATL